MTPKWLWTLQGQRYPYMLNYNQLVANFTQFYYRLQWWIWNFRKIFVKNRRLKMSKYSTLFCENQIGRKIQDKSENVLLQLVAEEQHFEIFTRLGSYVNEKEKKSSKFSFSKFQKSQMYFLRGPLRRKFRKSSKLPTAISSRNGVKILLPYCPLVTKKENIR